jgi:hypothetical protein
MLRTIEHDLAELLLHRSMIRASLGNAPKADHPSHTSLVLDILTTGL